MIQEMFTPGIYLNMCERSSTALSKYCLQAHALRLFQNAINHFCFSSLQFANAFSKQARGYIKIIHSFMNYAGRHSSSLLIGKMCRY